MNIETVVQGINAQSFDIAGGDNVAKDDLDDGAGEQEDIK